MKEGVEIKVLGQLLQCLGVKMGKTSTLQIFLFGNTQQLMTPC